jgi:hypothetical protein
VDDLLKFLKKNGGALQMSIIPGPALVKDIDIDQGKQLLAFNIHMLGRHQLSQLQIMNLFTRSNSS